MKYLYILLLILLPISIRAQINPHRAPLNPDFINQIDKTGYVYPPHKIVHNTIKLKNSEILPSSYDLRHVDGVSYIPSIRNQNPYGTCWAFAAYASVESVWKKTGDASFTDLSEGNMAKCHGYVFGIDEGGNEYTSAAYLTRLSGPVYESTDPYYNVNDSNCPAIDKTTDIPAYISNILWLGNDQNLLKHAIMTYGALATSMKSDFSSLYYNSTDYTFFYTGNEGINHGVSIIGWDDNKVVTGGSAGTPEKNGAWIIRNSWGSNANDNGYFYASYEDLYIGKSCELYYGKTPVSEIDTLFDHATLGAITSYNAGVSANDFAYAAVKYHANTDYFITHIGAAILCEGTSIDITLCKNFDGSNFSDTIASVSDIFCTYAGYQKIEFPTILTKGDFYLIVRYHTPNEYYSLPAEVVVEDYAYPEIEEGKLWVSPDANQWTPGGLNTDYDFDLAVKVIAKHLGEIQAYFTPNKTSACLNQEITFENKTIGEADSFLWYFPEDTFITNGKEETITLSFDKTGTQQVTLEAYKDGIAYPFTRQSATTIVSQIHPHISVAGASDYYSKGKPITLLASGGESYQWYAEGYLNGESGKTITISPDVDSIWVRLEATMGNCFETDSTLLKMTEVSYDDIEDALLLTVGATAEMINNAYATVQYKEPMPKIGSCESQNTWCEEGGLQNSIWFKFAAPQSGRVTINTTGFDNQIALYDAIATGTWQDILSGNPSNYVILAANDDYHEDYAAKIEEVSGLQPGKTYWIQMDGSAGGSVGKADITVSTSEVTSNNGMKVLPFFVSNTKEKFHLTSKNWHDANIAIINSMGQIVYKSEINSGQLNLSGAQFNNGFYLVSINSQNISQVFKVIISNNWQLSISEQ